MSGNTYNDCDICLGMYDPLRHKIKNHIGYPIIIENPQDSFIGLRDRYKNAILLKCRLGEPNKSIPLNFFGEIGYYKELPKPDEVSDWNDFLYLSTKDQITKDENVKDVILENTNTSKKNKFKF